MRAGSSSSRKTVTSSATGPSSPSNACSPVGLAPWGYVTTAVVPLCATHLRAPAQSAPAHPRIHYARRSRYQTWPLARPIFQKTAGHSWRGAVIRLLRASYDRVNPATLPGHGHIRDEKQWKRYLQAQYQRHWKVHFAKKTHGGAVFTSTTTTKPSSINARADPGGDAVALRQPYPGTTL
jgi:hypothetical protein